MTASKTLKKQIIIEIIALLILVAAIIYSSFAISKSNSNKISSHDGLVIILNDKEFEKLSSLSDGAGLNTNGLTYTITNNNPEEKEYKIVIYPNSNNQNTLDSIKISLDDMEILNLNELERYDGGYVLTTYKLQSGYTKIHLIKSWYKLDIDKKNIDENIKFDFKTVLV